MPNQIQRTTGDTFLGLDDSELAFSSALQDSDGLSYDHTLGDGTEAYNADAFRYFLGVERNRADRSRRSFLLLLVDLKMQPGLSADLDPGVATKLFAALRLCIRETDFLGWYRQGRVAGAVLTQHSETPDTDMSEAVSQRVNKTLGEALPSEVAERVQVRLYELPPGQKDRS